MKNSTNKILTTLFSIVFIIIFSIYNFDEYQNFHKDKIKLENQKNETKQNLENFELEEIKTIENIQFYYTPNKELLTKIVTAIDNTKKEIFLEVYMLTETRIQDALIKAYKK